MAYLMERQSVFRVELLGDEGSNYVIQASATLNNPVSLFTNQPAYGMIPFLDGGATSYPYRCCRAVGLT